MFQDKLTREIAAAAAQIKTEPPKNEVNTKSVEGAVVSIMANEELKGNQHKIDANKNGKVDAHDFKLLRGKKGKTVQEGIKGAGVGAALGSVAGGPVGAAIGGALGHVAGEVLSSAKNKTKAIGRIIKGPSMADSKMKREEVEQLDEIGDTKEGRKMISSYVNKALGDKNREKGLRKATSRLYKDNFYGKKNEEVEMSEEDAYSKDRYAVKDGKAKKDNPTHMGSPNYKDQPHHVWATSAEHALKKSMKKEEVEELDERAKWRTSSIAHNTGYRKDGPHGGIENTADTGKEDLLRSRQMLSRYGSPKKSEIKSLKKSITKNIAQMKKEEVEELTENFADAVARVGNLPSGKPLAPKPKVKKDNTGRDYFGHDSVRQQSGYRGPGQSVLQTGADAITKGAKAVGKAVKKSGIGKSISGGFKAVKGAVKKVFSKEEIEYIVNNYTLEDIENFMMSEEFNNYELSSQESFSSYLEEQLLNEIGDTPAGQKMLRKVDSRAFYKAGTKSGGKGNMADAGEKTLERTQARIKKQPGLLSRAAGAVKKVLSKEEVEAIFNNFTLDEVHLFMMSEEFEMLHVESQEQIDTYLEERSLNEGFPTVADAKKRMASKESGFEKKKISTGTVYSRKYKAEPEENEEMPKKKAKTMKEMLSIYSTGGAEALVENLMIEEPTNDEYKKEVETAHAKAEGKIRNDKGVAKAASQGVKMEEVEIEDIDEKVMVFHSTSPDAQMKRYQKDSPAPEAQAHRKSAADAARSARSSETKRDFKDGVDVKTKKGGSVSTYKTNEEYEIEMYDADEINGVQFDTIDERSMTDNEMDKREKIVKSMKKGIQGFKDRYGDKAKDVMYATATKQSMKEDAESVDEIYNPITVKKGTRRSVDSGGKVSYSGGVRVRDRGVGANNIAQKLGAHQDKVKDRAQSMWKQKHPILSKIKSAGSSVSKAIDKVAAIKIGNKNRAGG